MAEITCPKCDKLTTKGGYHTWQIIVAVCLFPIGLLALAAEKQPTKCTNCDHTWTG